MCHCSSRNQLWDTKVLYTGNRASAHYEARDARMLGYIRTRGPGFGCPLPFPPAAHVSPPAAPPSPPEAPVSASACSGFTRGVDSSERSGLTRSSGGATSRTAVQEAELEACSALCMAHGPQDWQDWQEQEPCLAPPPAQAGATSSVLKWLSWPWNTYLGRVWHASL